ncbi:zinc ribbon domain-containing protein [Halobacteria archaeon AArc-curdl1]|uniref:Zinc ribbon domain-containing protein n=1 Tax=Natronosalvus hydrolyticus TaxID=2979988 RepID=A0AAP2Z6K7_9EURY|nr:zinc ribbon domain-containing protein [Halobacteria archaeon AArc-curdl1]
MPEYELTCPDCGQQLSVDRAVLEATVAHGCPLCGSSVSQECATPL